MNSPLQNPINDFFTSFSQNPLPKVPIEDSYDVLAQLKWILSESIKTTKNSRDEIAELMTDGLHKGETISKAQIDSWTRSDSERHIPLEFIYAFEMACNTSAITEYFCKLHGGMFIDQQSSLVMKLGQLQVLKTQLTIKEQELKQGLMR